MIRAVLLWSVLAAAVVGPIALAATSPQLAWRGPVYVVAGFAGVVAFALLLVQPALIGGRRLGLPARAARKAHALVGAALVTAVVVHVGGLWIFSPPDVRDALLFASPTPFSVWGVVAMWAVFAAAAVAALRRRIRLSPRIFRALHGGLVAIVVGGTVVHALLIQGTMEFWSKAALSALAVAAAATVLFELRVWRLRGRERSS